MSAVKLKNDTIKAINAAIAAGEIPAGTVIAGRLSDRRIWIDIDAAACDTILPKNVEVTDYGISFAIELFGGDEKNYTPEGIALKAKVLEVAHRVCPQGVVVHFTQKCFSAQARRTEVAKATQATQAA